MRMNTCVETTNVKHLDTLTQIEGAVAVFGFVCGVVFFQFMLQGVVMRGCWLLWLLVCFFSNSSVGNGMVLGGGSLAGVFCLSFFDVNYEAVVCVLLLYGSSCFCLINIQVALMLYVYPSIIILCLVWVLLVCVGWLQGTRECRVDITLKPSLAWFLPPDVLLLRGTAAAS